MGVTRYTSGGTTMTLDGAMEDLVRRAMAAAGGKCVEVLEQAGERVAQSARDAWYTQVDRRTGESGDIQCVTIVDAAADVAIVRVGSVDSRKDKRGRPAAAFIRRPGPLATTIEEIPQNRFIAMSKEDQAQQVTGIGRVFKSQYDKPTQGIVHGRFYEIVANPKASDGKYILQELVRKPAAIALKAAMPQVKDAFARAVGGS